MTTWDCSVMLPVTIWPSRRGNCPDTYSQPSASTARANGGPPAPPGHAFEIPVITLGRLREPEEFGEIVVKTGTDGRITRIRDVARIELGARDYATNSYLGHEPAVAMAITQRPGSNALAR